jgi:hypothetical protein
VFIDGATPAGAQVIDVSIPPFNIQKFLKKFQAFKPSIGLFRSLLGNVCQRHVNADAQGHNDVDIIY